MAEPVNQEQKKSSLAELMAAWRAKQKVFGTDFWGYLGNGVQELQSVFVPNASHVELGANPVYGAITSGQITAERLGTDYEVPKHMEAKPDGKDVHGKGGKEDGLDRFIKAREGDDPAVEQQQQQREGLSR